MKKIKADNITWIDIKDPKQADIEYLEKNYKIHPLILGELIPPSQRSKVEEVGGFIYIVLYFPVFNKEKRETKIREIDIVVGNNLVVTSHYKPIIPIKELFNRYHLYEDLRNQQMTGAGILLYKIIDNMLSHTLPKLDNIAKKIDRVEEEIFKGQEKEMLTEISLLKRDILNMSKAIKPQNRLLRSLNLIAPKFFGKECRIYFHDLLGSHDYVREILKNHEAMIDSLATTNESLLSHKLNDIVRVLTVVSFIALPLTLAASVLGMNMPIGFLNSEQAFWGVVIIMAVMALSTTLYFKKKEWL